MRWVRSLQMRSRALFKSGAVDAELADEMREHFDRLVDEYVARGMTPGQARTAARREFGPVVQLTEASRDARGVAWIGNAIQDFKYGVRLMRRAPAFAAVATLTIALGIGATSAMFSVVYGVLLHPLPYPAADRLVNLWATAPSRGLSRAYVGMALVYDWKAQNHVFEDIATLRAVGNFNLTGEGEPERLNGSRVSAGVFKLLGVRALVGRTFSDDEDRIGHDQVAILTHGLWVRRFGADPAVVGRTIRLNGVPHTVVGVMGPEFAFPTREFQIYTPFTFDPEELVNRLNYSYLAIARLKPGVTVQQAQAEMDVISAEIAREHPKENTGIGALVAPMLADTVDAARKPLYILLAAVGAMLLIACANLTNLLVVRALARQRELALRAALGAGRVRLIAQSIGEIAPMLLVGGALGLGVALWAVQALVPLLPADLPRVENIGLHWPVVAVTAAALAAIALLIGVLPPVEASRGSTSMVDQSRGSTSGRARSNARDMLVVFQIAATLWLVIGAALLMRSAFALRQVDPGFISSGVYTAHLALPRGKYPTDHDIGLYGNRLLARVQAIPDVVAAAMVNRLPLAGGAQTGAIEFEGMDPTAVTLKNVDYRSVTPDYFRAIGIPLVSGRAFVDTDREESAGVAIIDERLAREFGDRSPLGHRVRIPYGNLPWLSIVGVVGHIRHDRLEEDTRPQIYFPFVQRAQDRMALVVRTRTDPGSIGAALASAIRSVDPEQPVYDARTLDEVVDRSMGQRWMQSALLGGFAAMAVLLAAIGVYGVIVYSVGQRQREFGIRLALGARRGEIVALVIGRGLVLFAIGAGAGVAAAVLTGRALSSLLFAVTSFDAASFGIATLVLLVVSLAACGLPARKAAGVDPSLALRAE